MSSSRANAHSFVPNVTASKISLSADWIGEINRIWANGAANTLELARTVSRARRSMSYGAWARMWRSRQLPFGISKAKMLVHIGEHLGDLDGQTFGHLPSGWSILYELSKLPRAVFEELIRKGVIHPGLMLREAKAMVARLQGIESHKRKANVRERLLRFAGFVRDTVKGWEPEERELATETLAQLIELIDSADGIVRVRNGTRLTFTTKSRV